MKTKYFIFLLSIVLILLGLSAYDNFQHFNKVQELSSTISSIPNNTENKKPKIQLKKQVNQEIKNGKECNYQMLQTAIEYANKDNGHLNEKDKLKLHLSDQVALLVPTIFSSEPVDDGEKTNNNVDIKKEKTSYQNGLVYILTEVEVTSNGIPLTKYVQIIYDPVSNQITSLTSFEVSPLKGGKE